jgi:hypothetical protein
MYGVDIYGSSLEEVAVDAVTAVFTNALSPGFYEVFAESVSIYVKVFGEGEATAQFTTAYPIWRGNSQLVKVPANGKLGFICASGEPPSTIHYIGVRPLS